MICMLPHRSNGPPSCVAKVQKSSSGAGVVEVSSRSILCSAASARPSFSRITATSSATEGHPRSRLREGLGLGLGKRGGELKRRAVCEMCV